MCACLLACFLIGFIKGFERVSLATAGWSRDVGLFWKFRRAVSLVGLAMLEGNGQPQLEGEQESGVI